MRKPFLSLVLLLTACSTAPAPLSSNSVKPITSLHPAPSETGFRIASNEDVVIIVDSSIPSDPNGNWIGPQFAPSFSTSACTYNGQSRMCSTPYKWDTTVNTDDEDSFHDWTQVVMINQLWRGEHGINNYSGVDFLGCRFNTYLVNSTMTNANDDTVFTADAVTLSLFENSHFDNINMDGSNWAYHDFRAVQFSGGSMQNLNLQHSNFSGVNLNGQKLAGSNFSNASLVDTQFDNALLSGANFTGADLTGADFSNADLRNVNFNAADIRNADFRGANLEGASFVDANTLGAIFDPEPIPTPTPTPDPTPTPTPDPTPTPALPENAQKNYANQDLSIYDLSEADLTQANLTGAVLSDQNLSNADLQGAVLVNARLLNVQLDNTALAGANLSGGNFSGSSLRLARGNQGEVGNFSHWLLTRTHWVNSSLAGVNLSGSQLAGADFSQADLSQTNLSNSDLSRARLRGAQLNQTNLSGARLEGADLTGATVSNADWTGATGMVIWTSGRACNLAQLQTCH